MGDACISISIYSYDMCAQARVATKASSHRDFGRLDMASAEWACSTAPRQGTDEMTANSWDENRMTRGPGNCGSASWTGDAGKGGLLKQLRLLHAFVHLIMTASAVHMCQEKLYEQCLLTDFLPVLRQTYLKSRYDVQVHEQNTRCSLTKAGRHVFGTCTETGECTSPRRCGADLKGCG